MFLDRVRVHVKGGDGGRGSISFRREAHVPRGGPDGGDGGHGGDAILIVDDNVTTLSELRFVREIHAQDGAPGSGKKRSGKAGLDKIVRIPRGTLVTERGTGIVVADLVNGGDLLVVARGGRGGKGNARFVTSVRRAPRIAEDGQPGEARELELELKLVADVGLAGLPNAGKSTLLAALTRAHPKIADYPFTTLVPNLGVARLDDRELVIADIPGLIEGAHEGAGLGEEFLRHIERTRLVVHIVDASAEDPLADLRVIERELALYGHGVDTLPRLVALNKMDLPDAREREPGLRAALGHDRVLALSAATGAGVDVLAKRLFAEIPRAAAPAAAETAPRRIAFAGSGRSWTVLREPDAFRVTSDQLERIASGMDWASPDATAYFHRLLTRSGVEKELRARGVKEGDTVRVGATELEWRDLPD